MYLPCKYTIPAAIRLNVLPMFLYLSINYYLLLSLIIKLDIIIIEQFI